jgi:hypothetical protein
MQEYKEEINMFGRMLMVGVCLTMLFTGVVYAQDGPGSQSIIIDDISDSFTIGYLVDMRGLDSLVILGPSIWEINERVDTRVYGRVATENWFGSIFDELNIPTTESEEVPDYSAGVTLDWAAIKYHGWYLNVYLGADYDLSNPFHFDSANIDLFPGVGITTPFSF